MIYELYRGTLTNTIIVILVDGSDCYWVNYNNGNFYSIDEQVYFTFYHRCELLKSFKTLRALQEYMLIHHFELML